MKRNTIIAFAVGALVGGLVGAQYMRLRCRRENPIVDTFPTGTR